MRESGNGDGFAYREAGLWGRRFGRRGRSCGGDRRPCHRAPPPLYAPSFHRRIFAAPASRSCSGGAGFAVAQWSAEVEPDRT